MQRAFLILLGLAALIGVGAGLYVVLSGNNQQVVVDETDPFTTSDDYVEGGVEEEQPLGEMDGKAGQEVAPKLIKITDEPVALGVSVFPVGTLVSTGSTTASGTPITSVANDTEIRYIERANGNAYAYRVNARSLARISNRTLPGVQKVAWLSDGSLAYAQYISNDQGEAIETFALPIGKEGGGYFLEPELSNVIVSGTSTLVTLLPSSSGSIATIASPDGTGNRTLFSSVLSRLRLSFLGQNILAYTNASAHTGGYAFSVNRTSGTFDRILGPFRGLTALSSPKGTYVFYTYLSGSSLRAELLDMKSRIATPIPLGALSEKCVWAADESAIYCAVPRALSGTIPDDWYQGALSFSDRIWRIDIEGRVAVLVVDPDSVGNVEIDAVSLTLDPKGSLLVFTNKKDGSLWSYSL